jgi:hypothetical protein
LSFQRIAEFIDRVIETPKELLPPSSYNLINIKGESRPLDEHHKEVLKWNNVGIVPDLNSKE